MAFSESILLLSSQGEYSTWIFFLFILILFVLKDITENAIDQEVGLPPT